MKTLVLIAILLSFTAPAVATEADIQLCVKKFDNLGLYIPEVPRGSIRQSAIRIAEGHTQGIDFVRHELASTVRSIVVYLKGLPHSELRSVLEGWSTHRTTVVGVYPGGKGGEPQPTSFEDFERMASEKAHILAGTYGTLTTGVLGHSLFLQMVAEGSPTAVESLLKGYHDIFGQLLFHEYIRRRLSSTDMSAMPQVKIYFDRIETEIELGFSSAP